MWWLLGNPPPPPNSSCFCNHTHSTTEGCTSEPQSLSVTHQGDLWIFPGHFGLCKDNGVEQDVRGWWLYSLSHPWVFCCAEMMQCGKPTVHPRIGSAKTGAVCIDSFNTFGTRVTHFQWCMVTMCWMPSVKNCVCGGAEGGTVTSGDCRRDSEGKKGKSVIWRQRAIENEAGR